MTRRCGLRLAGVALLAVACVFGCGGECNHPVDADACTEIPWSLEWCEGRPVPQTVFVGCQVAPRAACARAERMPDRDDAWCCW